MPERHEPIAPALTPGEWAAMGKHGPGARQNFSSALLRALGARNWAGVMALANAALQDGDRRKITRRHVTLLRAQGAILRSQLEVDRAEANEALADVLDAILPPASRGAP